MGRAVNKVHGISNYLYLLLLIILIIDLNINNIILALGKESGMTRAQLARRHPLHMLLYFTLARDISESNNIINVILSV